jgi:malate/lactate dehydrogenase
MPSATMYMTGSLGLSQGTSTLLITRKLASVAVITDGSLYGVPADLCFSFPTTSKDGKITVYQGLPWDDFSRKMVDITLKELLEERQLAFDYLKSKE